MQLSIPKLGFPFVCKNFLPVAVCAVLLEKYKDEKDPLAIAFNFFLYQR
jgi:hypothetical protein